MRGKLTRVWLSPEEKEVLASWVRFAKSEQRMVLRSSTILAAARGERTLSIVREMQISPATVSKWRVRFAARGLPGLQDAPRSGARPRYPQETERRILGKLDEPPAEGCATWTGSLLAKALGDVSPDYVRRVLRRHGIELTRRRSWCISTDPEFVPKSADIIGLHLDPPENALVFGVDEKPSIQALERVQGHLKLPNGRAITGFSHEYKRHGTTTLFSALNVATGQVRTGHYKRRRRRDFLDFMNELIAEYPGREIHAILDNLNTHNPKHDRWLSRHPNVHFHFTPTHASWLNQVECWLSILSRRVLKPGTCTAPRQVREAIDRFVEAYNQQAAPFEWTKKKVHPVHPKEYYADLCK